MVYRRRGFFCADLCAPVIMAFHPSFSALSRSSTTPPSGLGLSLTPPAVKITPASSEVAFAYAPGLGGRALFTGVNWSPAISNPFRQVGRSGEGLERVLAGQHAEAADPVLIAVHLASPAR